MPALVRDLFAPQPWRYWVELVSTGTLAWAAAAAAVVGPGGLWGTAACVVVAAILWHRATIMVHELTHQRRSSLPGFHLAWNLVVGVAWLFPSAFYERVHANHHRPRTYGTVDDPEYLQLAGHPWLVGCYVATGALLFPLLLCRFLVATPLSWIFPPLRRFLHRHGSSYSINPRFSRRTTAADHRAFLVWEIVIASVWWTLIGCTIAFQLSWRWLAIWYAIHATASLINRLRMMTAHHFESDGLSTDLMGQVRDTIDSPEGWWAELWAPLGLRYHALHHLFPGLPFHSMRTAYRRLATALPVNSVYRQSCRPGWLYNARNLLRRR